MRAKGEGSKIAANETRRNGFTLVELLVVIAIVLILTAVTIASVSFTNSADRIRGSARQIQSLLAGARDRAIYSKEVRGVRLLRDPNDSHVVNAIQYVGAPGKFAEGTISVIAVAGNDGSLFTGDGNGTLFNSFRKRGLIRVGTRMQIPRGTGNWYTISKLNPGNEQFILSRPYTEYVDPAIVGSANFDRNYSAITYQLELAAQTLPDSFPVPLVRGVVIDLDGSKVPTNWRPVSLGGSYPAQMDILFSARGTIIGDAAGLGTVHLHIADAGDVVKWKKIAGRSASVYSREALVPADIPGSPGVINVARDHILVTLTTRTGNVSVHPVDPANTATLPISANNAAIDQQNLADDPFRFAETGEVAGK